MILNIYVEVDSPIGSTSNDAKIEVFVNDILVASQQQSIVEVDGSTNNMVHVQEGNILKFRVKVSGNGDVKCSCHILLAGWYT